MIEVKNVTKNYGDYYAVRNISFEVKDGEIVGFLGRNGAGKTTTMNMITGFIEPTDGEIIVDGYNIEDRPNKVKSMIGYMPEGVPLYYELTVKEFVSYMADLKKVKRSEKKALVEEAIKATGLEKVQNKLTKNLSRGYKQRVSLAGTIVSKPKILILDEPTVGLDPKQVIEIRELIKSFGKNHTVILSSHILTEVSQICDRVIIIDKGEIIAVDTPKNLESKVQTNQVLEVNIEDENGEFPELYKEISQIESVEMVETKEDGTFVYKVNTNSTEDIRKILFAKCAEKGITILESRQIEASLEDAFMELISDRPELSQKEIKKIQYEREIEELRQEEIEAKELRESKRIAKKEEKARKNAKKESLKQAKENEKAEKVEEQKDDTDEEAEEDEGGDK